MLFVGFLFLFLFFSAFGGCFSFQADWVFSFFVSFFEPQLQADLRLQATRTGGAWWCRYHGQWRSVTRHLSPRSRIYAQEWHRKDIHSHIHPHNPCTLLNQSAKPSTHQTWRLRLVVLSCPMWWWSTVRKLSRCSSGLLHVRGLLAKDSTDRKHL